jgi:hypothetical protein
MHYGIQQDFAVARARHDDLLRQATQTRLAAVARADREPRPNRFDALRALMSRRLPVRRPIPAA